MGGEAEGGGGNTLQHVFCEACQKIFTCYVMNEGLLSAAAVRVTGRSTGGQGRGGHDASWSYVLTAELSPAPAALASGGAAGHSRSRWNGRSLQNIHGSRRGRYDGSHCKPGEYSACNLT